MFKIKDYSEINKLEVKLIKIELKFVINKNKS